MADKRIMTPEEKALLQARHRLEEAEARNRKKERDARTRRLSQEGAILESIAPHIKEMDLDSLKAGADAPATGNVNAQVLLPKGALTHHPINRAVVSPTGLVRSAEGYPLLQATSKGGARYGNLSYASQGRQPWFRAVCCRCICLYEL